MNKKLKKKIQGKCYFCNEDDYSLLDVHRILPGAEGGEYNDHNSLVVCSNCHRKCHSGRIIIHGRHYCSNGHWLLHYTEDNNENWK